MKREIKLFLLIIFMAGCHSMEAEVGEEYRAGFGDCDDGYQEEIAWLEQDYQEENDLLKSEIEALRDELADALEKDDCTGMYTQEVVTALEGEIERGFEANGICSYQLEGIQEEYRSCNIAYSELVTDYFAVLEGGATIPCEIDGRAAYCAPEYNN